MKFVGVLFFSLIVGFPAHSRVLISTVAQVKSHVITTREVEIHNIIQDSLKDEFNKFTVEQSVEQIIREWLLFYEASTFYSTKLAQSEVESLVQKTRQKLANNSKWKKLAVSDREFSEKVRRHLEARRLFVFKKKASVLPVSKAEIETEYTQNKIRYGSLSFEEAKEKIRMSKTKENLRNRLEQWFQVLEKKYKVQRFTRVS